MALGSSHTHAATQPVRVVWSRGFKLTARMSLFFFVQGPPSLWDTSIYLGMSWAQLSCELSGLPVDGRGPWLNGPRDQRQLDQTESCHRSRLIACERTMSCLAVKKLSGGFPQFGAAAILGVWDSRRGHRSYYRMAIIRMWSFLWRAKRRLEW